MSTNEQLEPQLEQQLADYFGWLEKHLGTTLSPGVAATIHARKRRRFAIAAAACVIAATAVAAVLVNNRDSTTPSIDSPATSSTPVASTFVHSSDEAMTWAPLNLPDTMEVVGVYNGVRFDDALPTVQYFGRLEGSSLETQLVIVVAQGGNYLVTDTEVHGLPATMLHPSATSVSVEWTEGDVHITATGSGLTDEEMLAVLNETTLRADPLQGIEPPSVGQGMTELLSYLHKSPADWSGFAIHDIISDTYVWVEPRLNLLEVGLLEEDVQVIPGVGQIFHDSRGQSVFVTTDGTQITLGHWAVDVPPTESQQVAIASAFALVTAEEVNTLRNQATTGLLKLQSLEEVSIASQTLVIRGDNRELPEALCLRDAFSENCHFNAINRGWERPDVDQMALTKVALSGEWFIIGYNQGEVGLDNGLVPRSLCIASAGGAVIEVLPDNRVDVDGREYFTAAVPPTVDYVRSCYLEDGTLVPASSGMLTRPVE